MVPLVDSPNQTWMPEPMHPIRAEVTNDHNSRGLRAYTGMLRIDLGTMGLSTNYMITHKVIDLTVWTA